jgi:hypothetical protein
MKTNIILSIITLFLFTSVSAQKKETVKVWGNCGMCQKTIENAAKSAGASEAEWNKETKILAVSYKGKKTNLTKIEQAIAASGYDTQNFTATGESYSNLPECCQYDRKVAGTAKAAEDCCKDGSKCEKDNAKCADCAKCKDGKCGECCKDGVCSTGKDCCKKA